MEKKLQVGTSVCEGGGVQKSPPPPSSFLPAPHLSSDEGEEGSVLGLCVGKERLRVHGERIQCWDSFMKIFTKISLLCSSSLFSKSTF